MEKETNPQLNFTTPEVTNVTPDSVTVAWNCEIEGVPEDSVSFEVFVKGEMADGSPFDRVQAPERNTCTITGLKEDTTYSVFVVAVHEGEDVAQVPDTDDGLVFTTPKNVPPKNWKKIAAIAGGCLAVALGVLLFFLLRDTKPPVIDNPVLTPTVKDNEVALLWNKAVDKVTEAQNLRYRAARTDSSGKWLEPIEIVGDTTYTFTGLKPWTTYKFLVQVADEKGNKTPYTELTVKTTDSVAPEIADPALIPDVGDDKVTIRWSRATDNVTGQKDIRYKASRTDDAGEWMEAKDIPQGDTTYTFIDLKPRHNYELKVEAFDEAGNATAYAVLPVATTDSVLPAVDDKTLTPDIKDNAITIKWKAATDNVTEPQDMVYKVSRTNDAGSWMNPQVVRGQTSYTFNGLRTKTNYLFRVEAFDEAGNCTPYDVLPAATSDTGNPDIKNKTLFPTISDNQIIIKWNAATDQGTTNPDNIRYKVYRTNESGSWLTPQELRGQTSYTFSGLRSKYTYKFRVEAYDESNNKSSYTDLTATTTDTKAPVMSNRSVSATDVGQNSFKLVWSAASDVDNVTPSNKIRYRVYWKESAANGWTTRDVVGTTSLSLSNLKAKTTYIFYVEAYDESGNRAQSYQNSTTTKDTTPPSVGNKVVTATNISHNGFLLKWNAASDLVTPANRMKYRVYWKETAYNGTYSYKDVTGSTQLQLSGLKPNTNYSFYVKASDESDNSVLYVRTVGSRNDPYTATTQIKPVHRIDFYVNQDAEPLRGSNTIQLLIKYTYYNASTGVKTSDDWSFAWSDKSNKNFYIELPANCYFVDNKIHVYVRGRATAVSSWSTRHDGWVDVTKEKLRFKLTGHYLSSSLNLGGASSEYDQFMK